MLNLANICTTQLLKAICPGPSYDLLRLQRSEKLIDENKQIINGQTLDNFENLQ